MSFSSFKAQPEDLSGVAMVVRPIAPILMPLLSVNNFESFCLGKTYFSPFLFSTFDSRLGAFLPFKNFERY